MFWSLLLIMEFIMIICSFVIFCLICVILFIFLVAKTKASLFAFENNHFALLHKAIDGCLQKLVN